MGVALVVVLVGGLVWSAANGAPTPARHPKLFTGSVVLDDVRPLTVVNLADATVTVRLQGIDTEVSAKDDGEIQAVPVNEGTMLVNRGTGTFNLLGNDDYLLDADGGGIGLGPLAGTTGARGFSDGNDVYIVRFGPRSTVSLVGQDTVMAGAKSATAHTVASVTPPGFAAFGGQVADRTGSVTVSRGNLWALVGGGTGFGGGTGCRLVESERTVSSHRGLTDHVRAHFDQPCATASLSAADGQVALATPGQVRLFGPAPATATHTAPTTAAHNPAGSSATTQPTTTQPTTTQAGTSADQTVRVPGTEKATELLPVTGSAGMVWYLADTHSGWSVFGVSADGKVGPERPLSHIGPHADLVQPVESKGLLYTMDISGAGQPRLWTIDPTSGAVAAPAGAKTYPTKAKDENARFTSPEVLVDGPRVIYNNPDSLDALTLFTDGSHTPVVIDKSSAPVEDATGPADIAGNPNTTKAQTRAKPPKTTPAQQQAAQAAPAVQPLSQKVTCANTTQTPHVPVITALSKSTTSVTVGWSYQLLDEQDCEPSSWSVKVTALDGAPQPDPAVETVENQNALTFPGLRPSTNYSVTVTAYINKVTNSATSRPSTFETDASGPDAPLTVTTTADGKGDWVVQWTTCTPSNTGCFVPATSWTATATSCPGSPVYLGTPPSATVSGSTDTVTIPAGADLGASVGFSVQGVAANGLSSPPTSDGTCTAAWQPPDATAIQLGATASPTGSTVTAELQVSTTGSSIAAYGSTATDFTYHVGGVTVGPTTATQVTVPGLAGGVTYTPTVTVYPAGHPEASVTVDGAPFTKTIPWPTNLAVAASATVAQDPNSGTVTASFPNLPAGAFSASGSLVCASASIAIGGPLAGGQFTTDALDLDTIGGACHVQVTLTDTASPNPYGVPSAMLDTPLTIGSQPAYSFGAAVDPSCVTFCSQAAETADVTFAGGGQPAAGTNWTITPSGACSNVAPVGPGPATFPYAINLSGCADPQGASFLVSWTYLGSTEQSPMLPLTGTFGTTTTTPPPPPPPPPTAPPVTTPPPVVTPPPPPVQPPPTPPTTPAPTTTTTVPTKAPTITSAAATTFTEGTGGSFTVTATGTPDPTFTEHGTLPTGVTLTGDGHLGGIPLPGTAGTYPITITAHNGVAPDATQSFTLTVDGPPSITSADSTTFTEGTSGSFTVTATGTPDPTFTETGTLPSGVTLSSNGTLSGTPAAGSAADGPYQITITATNGITPDATQHFTLTVDGPPPTITSAASTTFTAGTAGTFTVTATGAPAPTFTETGTLPSGVTLSSSGTLTATADTTAGTYKFTITATNGIAPDATQNFTLTVNPAPPPPTPTSTSAVDGAGAGSMVLLVLGTEVVRRRRYRASQDNRASRASQASPTSRRREL